MKNKNAVILLSGGLDSVVSLAAVLDRKCCVKLALTFDYGQKSFQKELEASKKIADFYGIEHKTIKLDWLKEITNTALVSKAEIPNVCAEELDNESLTENSMKNVWVPNRNGLFVNIAAAFCDSFSYDYVVLGANKEEAATFSDNSLKFIDDVNKSLETSVNYKVQVVAPLINLDKKEIVKTALDLKVPLEYINSCYGNSSRHCGACESCNRLKRALVANNQKDLIEKLFGAAV